MESLAPEADLSAALELMVEKGVHQLPIARAGVLLGMLSRGDVMRYLQLGNELHLRASTTAPDAREPRGAPSQALGGRL